MRCRGFVFPGTSPCQIGTLKYLEIKIEEWPSRARGGQAGPNRVKWCQTVPNRVKHGQIRSNVVKRWANGAKRGQTGLNGAKRGQTGPNRAKRCQTVPNGAKQGETGPKRGETGPKRAKRALRGQTWRKGPNGTKRGQMGSYGIDFLHARNFYEIKKSCFATQALRQKLAELWGFCYFLGYYRPSLKALSLFLYLSEEFFFYII